MTEQETTNWRTPTNDRRKVPGLLVEGVVILISILIAFFLEGWRADRELDREVTQALESVRRELERNQRLVGLEIVTLDRILTAGNEIVRIVDESTEKPTVAVPDTLAWLVTGWNISFSPSLGAVDALLASGRLAQVDDPELRLNLAGLRESIDDAFEEEVFAREINVGQVLPLLGETYPLDFSIGNEFFASRGEGLTPQERVGSIGLESHGSVEFPTRLPVRNALVHRMAWLTSARAEFSRLQSHLADVIGLVSAEID